MLRNKKDVQLSKLLSWLLRHSAIKEGLQISPEGYLSVENILHHPSFKGKYIIQDIIRVVNTNNKQRFKCRVSPVTQLLEIKANQGHSIKEVNDTELIQITEVLLIIINQYDSMMVTKGFSEDVIVCPGEVGWVIQYIKFLGEPGDGYFPKYKTVVHGTYFQHWSLIKANGLSRMTRKHIHFAKGVLGDPDVISGQRTDIQIYIFIDLEKALASGLKFYESENGVILTDGNYNGILETKFFSKVLEVKTGYPNFTQAQDLTHIFSNYGAVQVEKLGNKLATLNFSKVSEAKAAIQASKKIMIYGNLLTVKPHSQVEENVKHKRVFIRSKQEGVIVVPEQLDFSGDFLEQLDRVLAAVRLSQVEVGDVALLYADVESALQQLWPDCKALPFGSITTGLGIKTSDADCFISIPQRFRQPDANYVTKAKKVLMRYPQIFTEILTIPNANTPIVKFFHAPTTTNCDLSFKTTLGVQNSKLIAFLLHADPRIIPMAVFIKYWGKVNSFSGSGRLTNYALTMLIIFYLQQPPLSILPSVEWLQTDPETHMIVDFWNVGFKHDYEKLPRSTNTAPIAELLGGFFKYYATFDFQESVVCPFLGRPLKKDDFKDFEQLPNEFERYKKNIRDHNTLGLRFTTAMCVQDPFEMCHNVASPVSLRCAADIVVYFNYAAKAYDKNIANNNEGFLKEILLGKPILPSKKVTPAFRATVDHNMIQSISEPNWQSVIREIVFKIFEEIFKLKLAPVEDSKKNDFLWVRERYSGVLMKGIWKRKNLLKLYNMTKLGFLEKQIRITEEILNSDRNMYNINFEVMLVFQLKSWSKCASVSIKMTDGDLNLFREFGSCFLSVFNSWFKILVQPYLKPTEDEEDPQTDSKGTNCKNTDGNLNIEGEQTEGDSSGEDAVDGKENIEQECEELSENREEKTN